MMLENDNVKHVKFLSIYSTNLRFVATIGEFCLLQLQRAMFETLNFLSYNEVLP